MRAKHLTPALTLTLIATAVLLTACGKKEAAAPAAAAEAVVKIAHVGPVSGAIAHLGKDN
jgi:branched-chain amino acid transport system substrate-binding protein